MDNSTKLLNQIFELKSKIDQEKLTEKFERNFQRLFSLLEEDGLYLKDPIGEPYSDSRTDVEASIVGEESSKMKITKVIKPIVYKKEGQSPVLLQKGVVIVEKA
ncbi:MAG: hypothetical protein DI598_17165 [Pseudopedobacter saltans]|uniref:Nucleotide exchange factor GrpE n=1 Tax=Pseudopedobacter saltans TaxID=151895 RepID=A0A2W5ED71_9SPHI|nr:MAG: hypothetical protein DI598_17165 [Pseudopedobacter saltans]